MDYFQLVKELGVVAVVAVPFFFLIKWIAEEFKVTLAAHREERKIWADLYAAHLKTQVEHSERAAAYHKSMQEEHDRIAGLLKDTCLEHKEMIACLGRINGYKH